MRRVAETVAAHGIGVVYSDGWERRGNGSAWIPEGPLGHVNHHTAGGNNIFIDQNLIGGVPGLSGPLCNFCVMFDGDLGLIAAHPANHAGASGGWDTAPLPVTNDFNRRVWGTEIQYRAQDNPMSDAQYRTMCVLNAAMLQVMGWPDFERCKNHQGTSIQGKWDPGRPPGSTTYDIRQMRQDFAAIETGDDDMGAVADQVLEQELGPHGRGWPAWRYHLAPDEQPMHSQTDYLRGLDEKIRSELAALGNPDNPRPRDPTEPDDLWGHVMSSLAIGVQNQRILLAIAKKTGTDVTGIIGGPA